MDQSRLTFRTATDADIPALARLSFHSFPNATPIATREEGLRNNPIFPVAIRLVGEGDGTILTTMACIPFTTWIGGAPQSMVGLGGVAVSPEGRRYGYASDLVTEGLRRARAGGATISTLYPFRHDFYASLGYALCVERKVWTFNPADMPIYAERTRVRLAAPEDLPAVAACHDRIMRRSTLMVERSERYWEERIVNGGTSFAAVYIDEEGTVGGYLVFKYKNRPGAAGESDMILFSPEIAAEDEKATRGLLGYVATLRDQFRTVRLLLPPDERLELRLNNPRDEGAIMGPISEQYGPKHLFGVMARVLDTAGALRARPRYNRAEGRMRLIVDDGGIPENNVPLDLSFSDGYLTIADASEEGTATASMGIGPFTQLYLGYVTPDEALRAGVITADPDAADLMARAFAGPKPCLNDLF